MQEWSVSLLCQGTTPRRSSASVDAVGNSSLLLFGGRDQSGAATSTVYTLDLNALSSASAKGWSLVGCGGDVPSPRWGHSSCVYQQQLLVYGGFGQDSQLMDDMYSLDLASWSWEKVQQGGTRPNRQLGKHLSFHPAAASHAGHSMLAFGMQQQDGENADPTRPHGTPTLHSFDLGQHKWSAVHTAGSIPFQKLEALNCCGSKLIAVGRGSSASGKSDGNMQVCVLDLSSIVGASRTPSFSFASAASRSRPTPTWTTVKAAGGGMVPSARTAVACAVLGSSLILHGGMLCSKSVEGWLAADTFSLDLSTWQWTRLAPSQERAVGSNTINLPRANHSAVAVPGAAAVMLLGGTSSRKLAASCDTIECLRHLQEGSDDTSQGTTAAATGAVPDVLAILSNTPTLLGIQPFGHVTSKPPSSGTPRVDPTTSTSAGSALPAATPAVHTTNTPGASAAAAAAATAAPSSSLMPVLDFSRFCFSDALADIELIAGGQSFAAHRLLLCAQSPRLAQLIQGQGAGGNGGGQAATMRLHLTDIYPDVLALMLQYMYTALKSIPVESAPLLFKAADRYELPGLRAASLKVVIATMDIANVCHNVLLGHDLKYAELSQACIVFAAQDSERFQQILTTPGWSSLNQAFPRVGTAFVQAVTQLLMVK